ncbi:DNA-directed DNA polymerase [Tanacetum coccineum]
MEDVRYHLNTSSLQERHTNSKESPLQGFAAALAVLITEASQSRQHGDLDNSTSNILIPLDSWTSGLLVYKLPLSGIESRLHLYHFNYPERSLTMKEMLNKLIDEGKRKYEEMRAFIYDLQTNNKLLFKERNNSLIELRFGVQELLKVINNISMVDYDVKGVTIRGGKTTTQDVHYNDTNVLPKEPAAVEPEKPVGSNEVLTNDQPQTTSEPVVQPSNKVQTPPVPFSRRVRKEKEEAQQKKFLENLKQIHINLPLIEALAQMPKYAKILKGFLTNKARLEEVCKIIMNERCSAVLLNKLPSTEKDPGSFTIPYDIGQLHNDNALANLGASINLMPYTMYNKLDLGEPKATRMSLKLADRSIQYPRGIIKNVLIKVDKFVLPIDFVILDMPEDSRVPIILGRLFLETARAMVDVLNKKITLRVGDDEVFFDVDQSIKRPTTKDDECYGIDDLDDTINEEAQELLANEKPDSFLSRGLENFIDQSDLECCEYTSSDEKNGSDSENSIRRINSINMPVLNCPKQEKFRIIRVMEDETGSIAWKMMDDPNITMEEYIRIEEEKARRHVFNDTLTSEAPLSYEPTVSSLNNDEIDFRISFNEFDDDDYMIVFDKNSFSYKVISANDFKTDSENDNDKVNMPLLPSPEPTISYFDDLDFIKDC